MIIDFQRIQWYFAESAAEIDAARFVSYQAARDLDGGGAPRARHAHPTDRRPDPPRSAVPAEPVGAPGIPVPTAPLGEEHYRSAMRQPRCGRRGHHPRRGCPR